MMEPQLVRTFREGDAVCVEITRAELRHALSTKLLVQLCRVVQQVQRDAGARALVLTSAGDGVFCASGGIREMATMSEAEGRAHIELGQRCACAIEFLPLKNHRCCARPRVWRRS